MDAIEKQLLVINLDRFKVINNVRGSRLADKLLQEVARRLLTLVAKQGQVYRLGADEFAVLASCITLENPLLQAMNQPLELDGESFQLSVSLGIADTQGLREAQSNDLLQKASTALAAAKRHGGNQAIYFEAGLAETARDTFEIENWNRLFFFGLP
ncbi:diguanylate cyclase domain-containing protein [Marinospirillum celere]|uniref:diguanylate cyclase domain-containing protein n=1 Tax=Marinospirillum celere TaxID=1122252 RepID=UPI000B896D6B|nr:GGDEF domain-containing protein [Marinospirillum celere]